MNSYKVINIVLKSGEVVNVPVADEDEVDATLRTIVSVVDRGGYCKRIFATCDWFYYGF